MTTTTKKSGLPDFEGAEVHKAALKFSGAGTGMSEGLAMQPVALDSGETVYFVGRYECRGIHHDLDKDDLYVRIHKLQTVEMAPIDKSTAEKALKEYAREIEKAKEALDGQTSIDDELAAKAREDADETDAPADIAAAAAKRAKGGK